MRLAARTDGPQVEIIAALRKAGCYVKVIAQPVDLLVGIPNGRGHRWQPMEVKRAGWRKHRNDQDVQARFIRDYHIPVVRNAEEALLAAGLVTPERVTVPILDAYGRHNMNLFWEKT